VGKVEKGKLKRKKSRQTKNKWPDRTISDENMIDFVRFSHGTGIRIAFCDDKRQVESEYYRTSDFRLFKSFVSKCSWPVEIYIHHDRDDSKLAVDWMIKVCDCLKRWMPEVNVNDEEMEKEIEKYRKLQLRIQKRRKKPYFR